MAHFSRKLKTKSDAWTGLKPEVKRDLSGYIDDGQKDMLKIVLHHKEKKIYTEKGCLIFYGEEITNFLKEVKTQFPEYFMDL